MQDSIEVLLSCIGKGNQRSEDFKDANVVVVSPLPHIGMHLVHIKEIQPTKYLFAVSHIPIVDR